MRVSVTSTGGGTASASAGKAARRSAVYSPTGSTTQPSVLEAMLWAKLIAAVKVIKSATQSRRIAIVEIVRSGKVFVLVPCAFGRGLRKENLFSGFMLLLPLKISFSLR